MIGRDSPEPGLGNLKLITLDDSAFGRYVRSHMGPKLKQLQAMPAQKLLDEFFGGLEQSVPTALIGFVPLLALGLKLLYIRRPFFCVDHLVFALHFQSFLFLVFVLARLANMAGLASLYPGVLTYLAAGALIVPLYLLLSLKRVYGQAWPWTLAKCGLLGVLYLTLIQPVLVVTMFLVIRTM